MDSTPPLCPVRGSATTATDSASQIQIVLLPDSVTTRYPFGEYLTQWMVAVCPVHFNDGAGHDNNSPAHILMAPVNSLLKMLDRGDCEGRKGGVEI